MLGGFCKGILGNRLHMYHLFFLVAADGPPWTPASLVPSESARKAVSEVDVVGTEGESLERSWTAASMDTFVVFCSAVLGLPASSEPPNGTFIWVSWFGSKGLLLTLVSGKEERGSHKGMDNTFMCQKYFTKLYLFVSIEIHHIVHDLLTLKSFFKI